MQNGGLGSIVCALGLGGLVGDNEPFPIPGDMTNLAQHQMNMANALQNYQLLKRQPPNVLGPNQVAWLCEHVPPFKQLLEKRLASEAHSAAERARLMGDNKARADERTDVERGAED